MRRLSPEAEARRLPRDIPRPRIPVTMVCGPPASGKSSYVARHAQPGELLIDLDVILGRLSGRPVHDTAGSAFLADALLERNEILRSLAGPTPHRRAWFVIACPNAYDRDVWQRMLAADVVMLDVPAVTCIERIKADVSRSGQWERMFRAVHDWWAEYQGGTDAHGVPLSDDHPWNAKPAPSWQGNRGTRHERGYGYAWQKLRLRILARDSYLCQCDVCKRSGYVKEATEVDHIVPKAQGGTDDPSNLRSVHRSCHLRITLEQQGHHVRPRIGADGWPINA